MSKDINKETNKKIDRMTKSQVEKKLNTAVAHAVPDVKESILARCNETSTMYVPMPTAKYNKKRYRMAVISRIAVAVAAILLLVNIGVIGLKGTGDKQVFTTIDIDVNPSIELKINSKDRVVEVNAVNEDAIVILDGMDLTGSTTNVAVNALLGSMLSHGYLTDDTRTILVSVDSNDKANAVRVQEDIAKDMGNMLNTYSVQATVVSQTMTVKDEEVKTLAGEYGISQGKAELVQKIVNANELYNAEELSQMSVTELDTILTDEGATDNVVQVITTGSNEDEIIVIEANNDNNNDNNVKENSDNNEIVSNDNQSDEKDNGNKDTHKDENSSDNNESVSKNSASNNSVSDNSVSSNSVSENSVNNNENSISSNSVSNNSVSNNTVSNNSVSKNTIDKNTSDDTDKKDSGKNSKKVEH